jgi:hypothetical protein
MKKTEENLWELWDSIKRINIEVIELNKYWRIPKFI